MNEFHLVYLTLSALKSHFMNMSDKVVEEANNSLKAIGSDISRPVERRFNVTDFTNEVAQETIRKHAEFGAVYCQARNFSSPSGGGSLLAVLERNYEIHVDIVIVERGLIHEQIGIITEAVTRSIIKDQAKFNQFASATVTGKYPSQHTAGGGNYLVAGAIVNFTIGG